MAVIAWVRASGEAGTKRASGSAWGAAAGTHGMDASNAKPACPAMSEPWMRLMHDSLRNAARMSSPAVLAQGIESYSEKARLLRIIHKNGQLYVAFDGNGHYTIRGLATRLQFLRILDKFPFIADFDLVVNTHDWPVCFRGFRFKPVASFPAFSYSIFTELLDEGGQRKLNCNDIPFPDFTEAGWPESSPPRVLPHPLHYLASTWRRDVQSLARTRAFASRQEGLTFRGSSQRYASTREVYQGWLRRNRPWRFGINTTILNVGINTTFLPVYNLSNYKYLLHLPGNGYSSRLKYLMYGESLVFRDRTDHWQEWWSQGLVAQKHYVMVVNISDASNKTQWAMDNPTQVLEIINNARAYVNALPDPDVYMCHLLEAYAQKIVGYEVEVPPRTMDLATSLVDPFYPRIAGSVRLESGDFNVFA